MSRAVTDFPTIIEIKSRILQIPKIEELDVEFSINQNTIKFDGILVKLLMFRVKSTGGNMQNNEILNIFQENDQFMKGREFRKILQKSFQMI